MTPTPPLTRRQRQILDFYQEYTSAQGISPTLEEVAQNFGLNKVTVFGHVAELERKGVLTRAKRGISRGLQLVEPSDARGEADALTIRGRIAAGAPIEALESPELFEWSDFVQPDSGVYALRVAGDSMIEDGIHDGDLVMIEPRTTAKPGETVVAILPDEEATLKRYYPTTNGVRLEPANSTMKPIEVPEIEIRGVLVGLLRQVHRR